MFIIGTSEILCSHPGCGNKTIPICEKYCAEHTCLHKGRRTNPLFGIYYCLNHAINGNSACEQHECHIYGCTNPARMDCNFCSQHGCLYGTLDPESPNYSKYHCKNLAQNGKSCCSEHQCIANMENGFRCSRVDLTGTIYCDHHTCNYIWYDKETQFQCGKFAPNGNFGCPDHMCKIDGCKMGRYLCTDKCYAHRKYQ